MSAVPHDDRTIELELSEPLPGAVETLRALPGDVLVLGVGGKMGTTTAAMARRALDAIGSPARVLGVSRFSRPDAPRALADLGVIPLACDLSEPAAVAALPDAPNVLFLAGQKFGTEAAPEETWIQNVIVPSLVARRYRRARLVVFSTGCVYPFSPVDGPGAREGDALGFIGDYGSSCVGRERVFTHYAKQAGTPLLLFRLYYSVEYRYGVLVDIGRKVLAGEPVDVTTGWLNCIWQRDASARAIQCLAHTAVPPKPLNVTGPERHAVRDIAERFGRIFGRAPQFTGQESATAWLADASESVRLFGPPAVGLDAMMARIAAYLQAGGHLLGKPTHFEVRDGKF
jgi:nucleoside-diphosphate-sugar epimerase